MIECSKLSDLLIALGVHMEAGNAKDVLQHGKTRITALAVEVRERSVEDERENHTVKGIGERELGMSHKVHEHVGSRNKAVLPAQLLGQPLNEVLAC